jgi:hypothetical protein
MYKSVFIPLELTMTQRSILLVIYEGLDGEGLALEPEAVYQEVHKRHAHVTVQMVAEELKFLQENGYIRPVLALTSEARLQTGLKQ